MKGTCLISVIFSLHFMSRLCITAETEVFHIKSLTKIESTLFNGLAKFNFPANIEYTVTYSGGTFDLQLIKDESPTDFMHIGDLVFVKPQHDLGKHQFAVYKDARDKQFVTLKCDASTETCSIVGSVQNGGKSWKIRPKYGETDKYFATRNDVSPFGFTEAKIEGNVWEFGGEESYTRRHQDTNPNGHRRPNKGRRSKRSIMTECNIVELAIVADATVWQFFLGRNSQNATLATADLKEHYEALIGEVDLIFSCLPEDICLRVFLRDIIIQTDNSTDFTNITTEGQVDGIGGLAAVVDAANSEADMNLGFTRLPVQFNNFLDQRAVVFFESTCRNDEENSAVINEDHDGMQRLIALIIVTAIDVTIVPYTDNDFNADGLFVEIPTNEADFPSTYLFSDCAQDRLRISIEEFNNESINCLIQGNITDEDLFEMAHNRPLAGTLINEDHQCQLAFGLDSIPCEQINATTNLPIPTDGICGPGIFCFVNGACSSRTRVYSGTTCGPDQVCFKGECIDDFDCGAPPMVTGGFYTLDTLETGLAATATLNCFDGYTSNGLVWIICRRDGWSNATSCVLKDCGTPPSVDNGAYASKPDNRVGSIAVLKCDHNYTADSTHTCIICGTDGNWTTPEAGCIVDCGPILPPTPNGFFKLETNFTTIGAVATLCCFEGFMTNQTVQIVCNETVIVPNITCQPKDCGETPVVDNGNYTTNGNSLVGAIGTLVCNDHYTPNTTDVCISCGTDGNWTTNIVTCINGFFVLTNNMTIEGSTAFVVCCEGFMLNTTVVIVCEDTEQGWSTPSQTCQIKNCGETPSINNGSYEAEGNSDVGDFAVLLCDSGYTRNGTDTCISCDSDGNWSMPQAECIRQCGPVPSTPNGWYVLNGNSTTEGSTADLVCCDRYTINATVTITCNDDAQGWSTPSATCQLKACALPTTTNGMFMAMGGETTAGSLARLVCNHGFAPSSEATTIVCMSDGNYSTPMATCITNCGITPRVQNGFYELDSNSTMAALENATSTLVCCDDFIPPFGGSRITCTSGGWTSAQGCAACPNNSIWILSENTDSCYLFNEVLATYNESRDFCSAEGGFLVQIDNMDENEFLKGYARNDLNMQPGSNRGIWIGILNDTMWFPSGDPVIFTDWNTGQPDVPQSCSALWQNFDYRWADIECAAGILPGEVDGRESYALCETPSIK